MDWEDQGRVLLGGLVSGTASAVLFNPWDRALYLSVVHKRRFLSLSNWKQPFQGFHQAAVQRVLSGGLYFQRLVDGGININDKLFH